MIAHLHGKVLTQHDDTAVIDVNGVGYEVALSKFTQSYLETGRSVSLFIYTQVRDDAIALYGFLSEAEKQLFLSLIKVNGVGPKMAIGILSGAPSDQIIAMIESSDVKGLTQLPKVGKKTAEQLVLSLKGHLPQTETKSSKIPARNDVVSALINLGFRAVDVERVVAELPPGLDFEDGVRKGLSQLTSL